MKRLALAIIIAYPGLAHAQSYYGTEAAQLSSKTHFNVYTATQTDIDDYLGTVLYLSSKTANASKTFYLTDFLASVAFSTLPAQGYHTLGSITLESPASTKIASMTFVWPHQLNIALPLAEPLAVASGTAVRAVVNVGTSTPVSWATWLKGYER